MYLIISSKSPYPIYLNLETTITSYYPSHTKLHQQTSEGDIGKGQKTQIS